MGALASGLQSIGQTASDFGQAKFDYADWRQRQQSSQLNNIIQTLRIQQIQNQLKQQQLPQSLGLFKGAQGEYAGSIDPNTGEPSAKLLVPGAPSYRDIKVDEAGQAFGINEASPTGGYEKIPTPPNTKFQTTHAEDPLKEIEAEGIRAEIRGDTATAKKYRDMLQEWTGAKRATPRPNEIELITRSLAGDPNAKAVLADLRNSRLQQLRERGISYGLGRLGTYLDRDTGVQETMLGFDALAALRAGKNIVLQSPLSPDRILSAQRLYRESGPAIATVQNNIKAFDNISDQAIFSKAFRENPFSGAGEPESWYDSVINKAMSANLSPEGRRLAVSLKVLNETLGTLRGTLGLPATNSATAMTLGIAPGLDSTPDSRMAKLQLDSLTQVVGRSLSAPILGGGAALGNPESPRSPAASSQPPPGAKIIDFTDLNKGK